MKKRFILYLLIITLIFANTVSVSASTYEIQRERGSLFIVYDAVTGYEFIVNEEQKIRFASIALDEQSFNEFIERRGARNHNIQRNINHPQVSAEQTQILINELLNEWRMDDTVIVTHTQPMFKVPNADEKHVFEETLSLSSQIGIVYQFQGFHLNARTSRTISNPNTRTRNFYPVNGTILFNTYFTQTGITAETGLLLGGESLWRSSGVRTLTSNEIVWSATGLNPNHGFRAVVFNRDTRGFGVLHGIISSRRI